MQKPNFSPTVYASGIVGVTAGLQQGTLKIVGHRPLAKGGDRISALFGDDDR